MKHFFVSCPNFCLMTNILWEDKGLYTILSCHRKISKFLLNKLIKYSSINFPTSIFAFIKYLNMKQDNYHFQNTKKTWRSCTKIRSSLQNKPSHICHVFLRQKLTDGLYCLLRKLCVFNRISRRKIWLYLISLGLTVPAHSLGYNARRISNSSIPYLYSSFLL